MPRRCSICIMIVIGVKAMKPPRPLILLVDDEPYESYEHLAKGLYEAGFNVVQADSSEKALQICETANFSAIVTDCKFSADDMDGIQIVEEIKKRNPEAASQ